MGHIKSEFELEKALVLFAQCLDKSGGGAGSIIQASSISSTTITGLSGPAFGLTGIPMNNQYALNETNTPLNKQIVGLILYHRERCRDFKEGTCFCI